MNPDSSTATERMLLGRAYPAVQWSNIHQPKSIVDGAPDETDLADELGLTLLEGKPPVQERVKVRYTKHHVLFSGDEELACFPINRLALTRQSSGMWLVSANFPGTGSCMIVSEPTARKLIELLDPVDLREAE